jgi:hypothetical protein
MKKLVYAILSMSLLPFSQVLNAQINLEHTFEGHVPYSGSNASDIYEGVNLFLLFTPESNQLKLYNEDYSLYKTVTLTPPYGYELLSSPPLISRRLFNTNDKVEFTVLFSESSADADRNNDYNIRIYDEDGKVIKDFGNANSFSSNVIKLSNGQYKLWLQKSTHNGSNPTTYKTEIYSLPGDVSISAIKEGVNEYSAPYPNPSNNIVHIPYQLKKGEVSLMRIYNMQGQLLEEKQVDYAFNEILLDVSTYEKGVYVYVVNGVANRFTVE